MSDEPAEPVESWETKTQKKILTSMGDLRPYYDIIIVGAGLSGSVFAEQASTRKGLTSLIIEKRDHIGGNCYDYVDEKGIRVSHSKGYIKCEGYLI